MTNDVFISYRRDDSADITGRMYDKLVAHFGEKAIFKDVDSIPAGENFRQVIGDAVRQCKVVLVIIGKSWLNAANVSGQRRLEQPDDFVRIEVETALASGPRVIPVLVQNARMPDRNELPPSLHPLADRNGRLVRSDPDFHRDMEGLVRVLESALKAPAPPMPLPVAIPVAAGPPGPPVVQGWPPSRRVPAEIRLISHSRLFYWWPVWMLGFLLGLLTYFEDNRLAVLPAAAHVEATAEPGKYTLLLPADAPRTGSLDEAVERSKDGHPAFPTRVSDVTRPHGVLFLTVLVLVLFITNLSLRGLWSMLVILVLLLISVVMSLFGDWDQLLSSLNGFRVQINAGGYFFVAGLLFVAWLLSVFFFDPLTDVVFTPGQMRVREQIGGGTVVYDTTGMTLAKQRDDLFLHWVLGMGSGDVVVRTSGTTPREFHFSNVLFVSHKLVLIEEMMRDRAVVIGD